jgi:hypothetical protein
MMAKRLRVEVHAGHPLRLGERGQGGEHLARALGEDAHGRALGQRAADGRASAVHLATVCKNSCR